MSKEAYLSFREYIENKKDAVLLFVLRNGRGEEINRQVVHKDEIGMTTSKTFAAKFIVDELLSAKMIPGNYTLFMYVGLPSSEADREHLTPQDYTFEKCITEQGINIRVRGDLNQPSLGVQTNG